MFRTLMLLTALLISSIAGAQDAVVTDGDKYKVLLENDRIRMLEYRDQPGARTHQHYHPPFALYALSSFKRRITLPDGKVIMREFKPGDVMQSDGQTHIGENVGTSDTHVILVELKPASVAPAR